MPFLRPLRILALILILPAGWATAQEEAAEPSAAKAAEASKQKPSEAETPVPEKAEGEKAEGSKAENLKSEISSLKSDDKPADDKKADEKPADDKKPDDKKADEEPADDKKPDAEPAVPAQEELAQAPEPARLTGLGSVDGPALPGQPWRVHDLFRPQPPVVTPADVDLSVPPPSDAVVLFDGTDLALWGHRDPEEPGLFIEPQWTVENGYFQASRGNGDLYTLDSFGSLQLHLEWASPAEPQGRSQARGNSGVKFLGLYEVQILDSYKNRTYADGHAGAIYGQYPPVVNASRPPGRWQSYDIIFEIPQFEGDELVRPGYLTVLHNGVLVQHRRELAGVTGMKSPGKYSPHPPAGPIMLQDHGNPVRFRNIWVRSLD